MSALDRAGFVQNSTEYEMVGGMCKSERKAATRKAKAKAD